MIVDVWESGDRPGTYVTRPVTIDPAWVMAVVDVTANPTAQAHRLLMARLSLSHPVRARGIDTRVIEIKENARDFMRRAGLGAAQFLARGGTRWTRWTKGVR